MLGELVLGDVIARPKLGGVVDHLGIVVGFNRILHNTPERGEHVSSFHEFSSGQPVRLISRMSSWTEALEIFSRAGVILRNPQRWSLTHNCEVTVAKAQGLPPRSKQLASWAVAGAVVGIALLTLRS